MASSPTTEERTPWQIGMATIDITPEMPMRMGGYAARTTPSTGIHDRLWAKAAAFEDAARSRGVLVTSDLISIDAEFAEAVLAQITDAAGLRREQVVLNSSHTHGGPICGIRYPRNYGLAGDELNVVAAYSADLGDRLTQLVVNALADLRPARLSWNSLDGSASFAMNRRRYTASGVRNAPYPRGYVDRSVPVLRIQTPDGRPRGVLFGYSCHNTTLGGTNLEITADYAGYAQRTIESQAGVRAMFVQGFGADANPYPRGTFELAEQHGETLGREVCRVLAEGEFATVNGPLRIAFDHVDLPLEPPPGQDELKRLRASGGYSRTVADRIQSLLDSGKPWADHYRTPMAVWQFGVDLTLIRLSGEVVGDYVRLLEAALGPLNLWFAGYCADYFGYVPSARVHREGGYEARDFISGFGYLDAGVEDAVVSKVKALAAQAGRVGFTG